MTVAAALLLVAGVGLMTIAAVGLVRLRDPLQRMHSATKAGTLGTALVVAGVLLSGDLASPLTGILTILFLLFTLPIGAQLLGRATYLSGVPLAGIDGDGPRPDLVPGLEPAEPGEAAGAAAPDGPPAGDH